jgi:RimJ/RimL family protein N-acetyltransferase
MTRRQGSLAGRSCALDALAVARVACGSRAVIALTTIAAADDDGRMSDPALEAMTARDPVLATARLRLRELVPDDAAFICELLNDADFLRHIGDRGVRTREQARRYIVEGAMASYREHGFGLWCVQPLEASDCIGICGLVRRDYLDAVDIGYAFLPAWRGRGLALEACQGVMTHARDRLGLQRVLAIVSLDNQASARLLEKLGLRFECLLRRDDEDLRLFAWHGTSDIDGGNPDLRVEQQ